MTRVALVLFYVLVAIAAGCEVSVYGGGLMGGGAGLLALLICLQGHFYVTHRRERIKFDAKILELQRNSQNLEMALVATREKMEDLTNKLVAKTSAQSRKVVSELKMLEGLMREQAKRSVEKTARAAVAAASAPVPANAAAPDKDEFMARVFEGESEEELKETIRASLEENRVDLLLQPTVTLPQRKLRFYEAYSRLRTVDGRVIMPSQYMGVVGPSGLMSVIDNLYLFRCMQIVRRLPRKNREVAVFCNISSETLLDTEFFPQFLEYIEQNRDLAHNIVFEFSQKTILQASPTAEANLRALTRPGFALSMDHVETLALDFTKLNALGVRYIKVPADTMTEGLWRAGSPVAAEDLKTLMGRSGITLIVERIEEEKTVLQLLDYAVEYAQGYLFGEPRAVREEALRPTATTVEAPAPDARVIPLRRVS